MRRLLPIILTVFILLTQFGLVAHGYQDHQVNEVCHLCLASSQHDHVLTSSPTVVSIAGSFVMQEALLHQTLTPAPVRLYAARAPPRFL